MRRHVIRVVVACSVAFVALFMGVIVMQGRDQRAETAALVAEKSANSEQDRNAFRFYGDSRSDSKPDAPTSGENPKGEEAERQPMPEPPMDVPSSWVPESYACSEGTSRWRYCVLSTAEDAARELLPLLEKGGAGMVESGFLDISGNAWGCVCSLPEDAGALIITLLPCSYAFGDSGLEATIMMHAVSDWEVGSS